MRRSASLIAATLLAALPLTAARGQTTIGGVTFGPVFNCAGGICTVAPGGITNAMLAGSIDLTTKVTGTLPIANGGTGATALTGRGVVVMNAGGTAQTTIAPGANGNVLTSNGTDWTSTAGGGGGMATDGSNATSAALDAIANAAGYTFAEGVTADFLRANATAGVAGYLRLDGGTKPGSTAGTGKIYFYGADSTFGFITGAGTNVGLFNFGSLTADRTFVFPDVAGTIVTTGNLSAGLDSAFSSTQGSILYRGASAWAALGPGTSGNFLKTQGAGADPIWAATGAGTGCTTSGSANQYLVDDGAGGCTSLPYAAPTTIAAHQVVVATSTSATAAKTIPDCQDSGGNHLNFTQSTDAFSCGTSSSGGGSAVVPTPQGRLTLTTGTPVMTADVTAATTIYYDCHAGKLVPVGATLANLTITSCEISMGLDTTNVVSGSVYDIFAVNSSGLKLCVGPAWTSTTARGTGAGTTQIDQANGGIWTNTVSLTNCYGGASGTTNYGSVAAGAATYLGSLYATANGQTGFQIAAACAGGGSNAIVGLYNAYNQKPIRSRSCDNTSSWTYATNTWRAANNNNNNRITYLDGLGQSQVRASYNDAMSGSATTTAGAIAVIFDSTSATPDATAQYGGSMPANALVTATATAEKTALGLHYAQEVEIASAVTMTFFGSTGRGQVNLLTIEYMN